MLAAENMNPEYYQQAQRLQELRRSQQARQQATAYDFTGGSRQNGFQNSNGNGVQVTEDEPLQDPLIFPGVYAPSGFNIMDILVKVHTRPNPTINIGNIDHSVALTLCDSDAPDMPIIYCSEPFENLIGYSSSEILGQNCRFLQRHPHGLQPTPKDAISNDSARKEIREKIRNNEEARVQFVNYAKDGRRFVNILTTIPITWEGGKKYMVGFQVDAQRAFVQVD